MPLPYTQVIYQFSAAAAAAPSISYYGAVMGKARRIHDLESKGYFTPQDGDCGSGSEYDLDYSSSDFILRSTDYPALVSGNEIDVDTVKVYLDNLKYVGMHKVPTPGNILRSSAPYIGLPRTKTTTMLAIVEAASATFQSAFKALVVNSIPSANKLRVSLNGAVILSPDTGSFLVPGTVVINETLTVGATSGKKLVLTDAAADQTDETVVKAIDAYDSEKAVTGQMYLYNDDGYTIEENTLTINYLTGVISGYILIDMGDAVSDVSCELADAYTAAAMSMLNVAVDDAVCLSRQGIGGTGSNIIGPGFTITSGSSGGVVPKFTGIEDDMKLSEIKERYNEGDPDLGPSSEDSVCEYLITAVDYTNGIVTGATSQVYDENEADMDYRPHYAVAHIVDESARARRLREDADFTIDKTGPESELAQIELSVDTLIINNRVRAMSASNTYADEAENYYDDPDDYPYIVPAIAFANFISGSVRVEYEEEVVSGAIVDIMFKLSEKLEAGIGDTALINTIGQFDPRNELGFAVGLIRKMTTTDFYIVPYETLADALTAVQEERSIFHIWNVDDDNNKAFADWVDTENLPKNSRFRIGYETKAFPTTLTKIYSASGYSGVISVDANTFRRKLTVTGLDFINKAVAPGDMFYDTALGLTYTIEHVGQNVLTFAERYSRVSDYNQRPMTLDGSTWKYQFSTTVVEAYIKYKFKYRKDSIVYELESDVASTPTWLTVNFSDPDLTLLVTDSSYEIIGTPKVSVIPADVNTSDFSIVRTLTPTEMTNLLVTQQIIQSGDYVSVLSKDIQWKKDPDTDVYDAYLPHYAIAGLIFSAKLQFLPHMPLTEVFFDTFEGQLGSVEGFRKFKRDDHLELLGEAGYCMINSKVGAKPYCESDYTTGHKIYGDSDRGLLSKITPVRLYGKDTYEITKRFKGPYNTDDPEVLNMIGVYLEALKSRYTNIKYSMLGTLLKSVADQTVSFSGSKTIIKHKISSQDPMRYVENTIEVV